MTQGSELGLILKILYVQGGEDMRIKSIFVKKYKNICEQTLTFPNDSSYVALIGLNNSGKSNWLEAISLIFRDMYTGEKAGFTYKVNYDVDGKNYELTSRSLKVDGKTINKKISAAPSNVIACYSGESLRLWRLAYEEYYMTFFSGVAKNEYSDPKMMYINKYSWAICLIVLMCSEDETVRCYLKDHLGIEELSKVNVEFEFNEQNIGKLKDNDIKGFLSRIYQRGKARAKFPMSMIGTIDIGVAENKEKCKRLFYILLLAAMPKRNEQIRLEKSITKIGIDINGRLLEDISEGEKKLILITCITKILADNNSLLILDEPDAHVHVANKMHMCDLFRSFDGQIVLTTHSPLFSDKLGNYSLRFINDGRVEDVPRQKRVSTLSDGYVTFVDGACLLSSKNMIVVEGHYDIAYIKRAIEVFSKQASKYSKLYKVGFIAQGGADQTGFFIDDAIMPVIDNIDKIVFLFDFDDNGMNGMKEVKNRNSEKILGLYYSDDYVNGGCQKFYLEDYFPADCFSHELYSTVQQITGFKKFRDIKEVGRGLPKAVKTMINKSYMKFGDEKFYGFKPLLDKLLNVFDLA